VRILRSLFDHRRLGDLLLFLHDRPEEGVRLRKERTMKGRKKEKEKKNQIKETTSS